MYGDDRFGNKAKTFNVTSKWGSSIVDGTLFTVSSTASGSDTTDVLKVYEGSVRFKMVLNKAGYNQVTDKGAAIKQIYDDYKSGKITAEEFAKKMQEAETGITQMMPKEAVHVTAGYKSTITNGANATDPEPFDVNADTWWDDKNFKD